MAAVARTGPTRRPSDLRAIAVGVCLGALLCAAPAPGARADAVAYLVNVTVRPGYNFANAQAAIGYGRAICDKVAGLRPYTDLTREVMSDFATPDDYQASYLINQAVGELCPEHSWQLRQLAATRYGQDR